MGYSVPSENRRISPEYCPLWDASETDPVFSLALWTQPYAQFWFHARNDALTWPTNGYVMIGGELTPHAWQHIAMVRDYGKRFKLYAKLAVINNGIKSCLVVRLNDIVPVAMKRVAF